MALATPRAFAQDGGAFHGDPRGSGRMGAEPTRQGATGDANRSDSSGTDTGGRNRSNRPIPPNQPNQPNQQDRLNPPNQENPQFQQPGGINPGPGAGLPGGINPGGGGTTPSGIAPASPTPTSTAGRMTAVDLNSASAEELKKLPGVDDQTAQKIIAARPFRSKQQLLAKKVIDRSTYRQLQPMVVARRPGKGSDFARAARPADDASRRRPVDRKAIERMPPERMPPERMPQDRMPHDRDRGGEQEMNRGKEPQAPDK
jgi:hypothetical protein